MKVLLVRLSSIGDVIQGIPALVTLKESFPDWDISWLVEETSAPLLENHPCLSRLFVLKRRWRKGGGQNQTWTEGLANFFSVLKEIRREKFDIAIDLQGLFKSGFWTWLSGAPRRIGHNKTREFAHLFLNEYCGDRPVFDPNFPLIERYLEPMRYLEADPSKARYLLAPVSHAIQENVDRLLASAAPGKPLVALCPQSNWVTKDWPLEKWCGLAAKLRNNTQLILIGSEKDAAALQTLSKSAPGSINLCGKTSLLELAELFRRCRSVVGGDTGPVHLANAVDVPRLVMIFGATSYRRSGPWGKDHTALSRRLSCQPCFDRQCQFKHMNCLRDISEEEVFEEVSKLFS